MNTVLEHLTGMHTMTDQVIAMDFLIAAKTGVRNYSIAITETATPELKAVLRKHLEEAVLTHETITNYMMQKGYYLPYDPNVQIQNDLKNMQNALNIPS
jgi:similar to spore coat protein